MSIVKNKSNQLSVLIVGCGNIAGAYDFERSIDDLPYSHAGAYIRNGQFNLTACVEPDEARRNHFMDVWKIPMGFNSIEEALESDYQYDVISICSPTNHHLNDLEIALRIKPKLIFCEKPITTSLVDSERLVVECRKANILLAVNYTRRWDPWILEFKTNFLNGKWGVLRSVTGIYNKGLLNNGSHILDLLCFLIGTMDIVKVGKPIYDFFPNDPTVPLWLDGPQELPIHLACGHAQDFTFFELQFIFSLGVLAMEEGGMYWRERFPIDSATFKGYRMLDEGVRHEGKYSHSMIQAIENIYLAVEHGKPLISNGETALVSQRICEQVNQQI